MEKIIFILNYSRQQKKIMNKKKKNKRWYAAYMYEDFYKLVARLMYGISEDELKRLKNIINNRKLL